MTSSSTLRWRNRILAGLIFLALGSLAALKMMQPINLTAVDIGRHVKNGELILAGYTDVLHKNFYSFTYPDYPFINHHWFFGVFSYEVWKWFGFDGLSWAYIAVTVLSVVFFVWASLLRGHFALVVLFSFLALPIICSRPEIRPEGISYLFMGLYFYLLTKLSLGQVRPWIVFTVLSLAQIIWVNTHIFFFIGPLLTAVFLWEGANRGCHVCVRHLRPLLLLTLALNLLNPSGLAGTLTPFNIFKGLGYRLAENQNVVFMMSFFPSDQTYPYCLFLVIITLLGIPLAIWARGWRAHLPFTALAVFAAAAGFSAVRLMAPLAFFLIPLGAYFFGQAQGRLPAALQRAVRVLALAISVGLAIFYAAHLNTRGIGLIAGANNSAEFFKNNGLKGPIFSNYDIGGYIIYHLAPAEKVFVDNRQEAFPPDFFKNTYIPMQEDEKVWKKIDAQYGFNMIYFYRHDLTPWGQNFLIARVQDPAWAPVFVDGFTIIFAKRNAQNQSIITRGELPKSMFSVSHNPVS